MASYFPASSRLESGVAMKNAFLDLPANDSWAPTQAYILGGVCLALGLAFGFLLRGSAAPATAAALPPAAASMSSAGAHHPTPTIEQMREMADKQAAPLLESLKTKPNDAGLLARVARIYESTHQFGTAAAYFRKSLAASPRNAAVRSELASCLYYGGDTDAAIHELEQTLKAQPKDPDSLFNLGLIRWKGKDDPNGALEVWDKLLKTHPELDPAKKSQVESLIAQLRQSRPAQ